MPETESRSEKIDRYRCEIISNKTIKTYESLIYLYNPSTKLWECWTDEKRKHFLTIDFLEKEQEDITDGEIQSIISFIRRMTFDEKLGKVLDKRNSTLVPLDDKVLDVRTGEMRDYDESDFFLSKFHYTSDPLPWICEPEKFLEVLEQLLSRYHYKQDIIEFLQMAFGLILVQSNLQPMGLVLWGPPGQGKSTIINALIMVLGDELVLQMNIAELNDQFKRIYLVGKNLLIDDDATEKQDYKSPELKKMITGAQLDGRLLFKDVVHFYPYNKVIVASNYQPKLKVSDGAFRRFSVVRIDRQSNLKDPTLKKKLFEEKESIFYWLLEGAIKAYQVYESGYELEQVAPIEIRLEKGKLSDNEIVVEFVKQCLPTSAKVSNAEIKEARLHFVENIHYKEWPSKDILSLLKQSWYSSYKSNSIRGHNLSRPSN